MYFRRSIEAELQRWKKNPGHKVLELRGSRQVGKTTTLKRFAEENYKRVVYICAIPEIDGESIRDFFRTHDKTDFGTTFSMYCEKRGWDYSDNDDTVILIDEIQESKFLYEHIRMFGRELKCDVIITGSYLQKAKSYFQPANDLDVLTMYPLSFEEFIDYYGALDYYKQNSIKTICEGRLQWFKETFDIYASVGGYPSVLRAYVTGQDVTEAKARIVDALLGELRTRVEEFDDFIALRGGLYAIIELMCVEKKGIRRSVEGISKITPNYSSIRISTKECYSAINWLVEAGFIGLCDKYDSKEHRLYIGERIYFNDLGIFTYLCQNRVEADVLRGLRNETYVYKLLHENSFANTIKGEQPMFAVYDDYELDFRVTTLDGTVYGIEVKSGNNKGKSANFMLEENLLDVLVYMKGDAMYGENNNSYTIPLCLASKFEFRNTKENVVGEIPKVTSF